MKNTKSGLATAGLVLGIVGICLSFIPILNNAAFFLGLLAIIFAIISLVKKLGKGKAIAALVLGILSIVITLTLQSGWSKAFDELDTMLGNNTEEVLKNVEVNIGEFEAITNELGITETKLTVKITNKTESSKSFSIEIEAVSADGTRIDTDIIYANNLSAGQSQNFDIFNFESDDTIEELKSATFKVIEASMY